MSFKHYKNIHLEKTLRLTKLRLGCLMVDMIFLNYLTHWHCQNDFMKIAKNALRTSRVFHLHNKKGQNNNNKKQNISSSFTCRTDVNFDLKSIVFNTC